MLHILSNTGKSFPVSKIQNHKMPKLDKWVPLTRIIEGTSEIVYTKVVKISGSYFIIDGTNYYVPDPNFKNENNFTFIEKKSERKHRAKGECFSPMTAEFRGEIVDGNDCTVFSSAKAFDVSYAVAHHVCKDFGRKEKRGMLFNTTLQNPEFGKRFGKQITQQFGYLGKTVHTFLNDNPEGTYFVIIHRHVFAVVNGVVHDSRFWNRSKIESVYKVVDSQGE